MPNIQKIAVVPYSAEKMYNLVDDIEKYPEFLPWCKTAVVHERAEDFVKASLRLAKGGIEKSFTTINRLQSHKMIEVRLVEGPFAHLEGCWFFESLGENHCKISLNLSFEFSTPLLAMIVGPLFNQIANSLVDAFSERAALCYD